MGVKRKEECDWGGPIEFRLILPSVILTECALLTHLTSVILTE